MNKEKLEYQLKYLDNLTMVSEECRIDLKEHYQKQLCKIEKFLKD